MRKTRKNLVGMVVTGVGVTITWWDKIEGIIGLPGTIEDISAWRRILGSLDVAGWVLIAVGVGSIVWVNRDIFDRRTSADPAPDMSADDAYRYLVLDSKWAIGRDVDLNKTRFNKDEWSRTLFSTSTGELRDAANLGRLKIWGREKQPGGGTGAMREVRFDDWSGVSFGFAIAENAAIHDYKTDKTYFEVMLNEEQVKALWPKANWLEKRLDKMLSARKEFLNGAG